MKDVYEENRVVTSEGFGQSATMKIKATGRSFRNLVDSIYSKKAETVVRELIANALDSHAKAGCEDVPIKVSLPSHMEPNFAVRDFGVGMSHDFIMEHYSTLFESTKQDSNEETGMFGIGSKSPLALVDAFILSAFDGKEVRAYEICVPQDGVPRIDHSYTMPSEEPRGIEVTVPLGDSHRREIIEGLANQHFSWFDKRIVFEGVGYEDIDIQSFGGIIKLTDRVYLGDASQKGIWNVYVRQGAAVYPLDASLMYDVDTKTRSVIRSMSEEAKTILIDLPIGTCSVTMSREAIQYDEVSKQRIINTINEGFDKLQADIESTIGNARTYPTAAEALAKTYLDEDEQDQPIYVRAMTTLVAELGQNRIEQNWKQYVKDNQDALPRYIGKPSRTFELSKRTLGFQANFHAGSLYAYAGTTYVDLSPFKKTTINIVPSDILYIVPSHLKWNPAINEHLVEESKKWKLPPGKDSALQVWVIRCARRYVKQMLAKIEEAGVFRGAYFEDDLPESAKVRAKPQAKAKFSKTAVYPWVLDNWGGKIEPCYTSEAYYVVRHTSTHDLMVPPSAGGRVKSRINRSTFRSVLDNSEALGFYDKTIPIYRLTAGQAEVMKGNTLWKNLLGVIDKKVIQQIRKDEIQLNVRASLLSHTGHHFLKLSKLLSNNMIEIGPMIIDMMRSDPLFALGFGVPTAMSWRGDDDNNNRTRLGVILSRMYGHGFKQSEDKVFDYNRIAKAFDERYIMLERMLTDDSHVNALLTDTGKAYFYGMLSFYKDKAPPLDLSGFPELTAMAAHVISVIEKRLSLTGEEDNVAA